VEWGIANEFEQRVEPSNLDALLDAHALNAAAFMATFTNPEVATPEWLRRFSKARFPEGEP
jgi:hypothetical protein